MPPMLRWRNEGGAEISPASVRFGVAAVLHGVAGQDVKWKGKIWPKGDGLLLAASLPFVALTPMKSAWPLQAQHVGTHQSRPPRLHGELDFRKTVECHLSCRAASACSAYICDLIRVKPSFARYDTGGWVPHTALPVRVDQGPEALMGMTRKDRKRCSTTRCGARNTYQRSFAWFVQYVTRHTQNAPTTT
jgi:hypothetical protein